MALDSNGIWQFEESDPASPFSDLLNLLAASTSDKVEDLSGAIAALDALWSGAEADIAVSSGWAATDSQGHRPRVRALGPLVLGQGSFTRGGATGALNLMGIIPPGFRPGPSPTGTSFIGISAFTAGGGTAGVAPLSVNITTGAIGLVAGVGYGTGAPGNTSVVPFTAMWWRQ